MELAAIMGHLSFVSGKPQLILCDESMESSSCSLNSSCFKGSKGILKIVGVQGGEDKFPSFDQSISSCMTAGAWTLVTLVCSGYVQDLDLASSAVWRGLCWMEMSLEHTVASQGFVLRSLSAAASAEAEVEGEYLVAAAQSQASRSKRQVQNFPPLTAKNKGMCSIYVKTWEGKTKVFRVKDGDTVASLLEAVEGATTDC